MREAESSEESLGTLNLHIHDLPNELLSHIFALGLQTNAWLRDRAVLRAQYLTVITSVCKLWRSITLAAPLLWSSIAFRPRSPDVVTSWLKGLKLWLKRSAATPLDVYIDFRPTFYSPRKHDRVEQAIRPHLPRVSELMIGVSRSMPAAVKEWPVPTRREVQLKRLQIGLSRFHLGAVKALRFPFPLESFALWNYGGISISRDFLMGSVLPDFLMELDVSRSGFDDQSVLQFLLKCTALRALKIGLPRSQLSAPLTLQHLQYLEIHRNTEPEVPLIVTSAPNVVHLKLSRSWVPIDLWPTMPILRNLTITYLDALPRIDELPATIVDLRIYGGTIPLSSILDQLVHDTENRPSNKDRISNVLPHLAYLRLKAMRRDELDGPVLTSLLQRLLRSRPSLRLHLMLHPGMYRMPTSVLPTARDELRVLFGDRVECDDMGFMADEQSIFEDGS